MFSRPKILFLVSLLFVAPAIEFNPYLPFKFLIFYHSSIYTTYIKLCYRIWMHAAAAYRQQSVFLHISSIQTCVLDYVLFHLHVPIKNKLYHVYIQHVQLEI